MLKQRTLLVGVAVLSVVAGIANASYWAGFDDGYWFRTDIRLSKEVLHDQTLLDGIELEPVTQRKFRAR